MEVPVKTLRPPSTPVTREIAGDKPSGLKKPRATLDGAAAEAESRLAGYESGWWVVAAGTPALHFHGAGGGEVRR